jgi:hypothetical protein
MRRCRTPTGHPLGKRACLQHGPRCCMMCSYKFGLYISFQARVLAHQSEVKIQGRCNKVQESVLSILGDVYLLEFPTPFEKSNQVKQYICSFLARKPRTANETSGVHNLYSDRAMLATFRWTKNPSPPDSLSMKTAAAYKYGTAEFTAGFPVPFVTSSPAERPLDLFCGGRARHGASLMNLFAWHVHLL